MVYLVSIIPVGRYEGWKQDFDDVRPILARLGVRRHWLLRGADDRDEVMMVLELPSVEHARRLLKSDELHVPEWLDRMGLEIYPTFFVGERVEVVEYPPHGPGPV